ncbi:ESAT-6 like protein ESXC [Mycobacterium tuberculosis]|nr:ESAT-6 like protein ESXC [Mycobacterium tuberculosis]
MSDQITYNPGAVSDFASDVGSRAGQLHMIYEDTASKTNALQEFFAGHGAQGFFDAQAQMLSGLPGTRFNQRRHLRLANRHRRRLPAGV